MIRKIILILIITLNITLSLQASTKLGGRGLIYIHSARILPKGYLEFFAGTRYFGKIANFGSSKNAFTFWNVQGFTSFNYGINSNLELAISPILYQDTNSEGGNIINGQANFPDNILLSLKFGSFGSENSNFLFGGLITIKIPTAKEYNIIYEPYSADNIEAGIKGIFSYYSNILFPEDGWSLHGNLGYWNHYDVGVQLTENPEDPKPSSMSSQLLFGVGVLIPAGTFDFSGEINARYFINKPPVTAYSREYVAYLTAGIYYHPYKWLTFQMGVDVKLFTEDDQSDYINTSLRPPPEKFSNYPAWRSLLGIKISLLPSSLFSSPKDELRRGVKNKKQIFERMLDEKQDTENAEKEISRIREKRLEVEKELERLRKLLEKEKKKKK